MKQERIVIETKMTRVSLGAKEIGDELIIDLNRYEAHPDCSTLCCFIYDPDGNINNPDGLASDLTASHGKLKVIVFIRPK